MASSSVQHASPILALTYVQIASSQICTHGVHIYLIGPTKKSLNLEFLALQVSWEEMTEAAMTHLLRTSLARSAKDAAAVVAPLSRAQDTARLTKHISLVLERLSKGMRLADAPAAAPQAAAE